MLYFLSLAYAGGAVQMRSMMVALAAASAHRLKAEALTAVF
jgi:hypothetical protein